MRNHSLLATLPNTKSHVTTLFYLPIVDADDSHPTQGKGEAVMENCLPIDSRRTAPG